MQHRVHIYNQRYIFFKSTIELLMLALCRPHMAMMETNLFGVIISKKGKRNVFLESTMGCHRIWYHPLKKKYPRPCHHVSNLKISATLMMPHVLCPEHVLSTGKRIVPATCECQWWRQICSVSRYSKIYFLAVDNVGANKYDVIVTKWRIMQSPPLRLDSRIISKCSSLGWRITRPYSSLYHFSLTFEYFRIFSRKGAFLFLFSEQEYFRGFQKWG